MKNIMVVAFSRSLKMICDENIDLAKKRLESTGYNVTFSKNSSICDSFISSSIKNRVDDFNYALKDKCEWDIKNNICIEKTVEIKSCDEFTLE